MCCGPMYSTYIFYVQLALCAVQVMVGMVVVVVATFICIYNSVELELFACTLLLACSLKVIDVKCKVRITRCRIRSFLRGRRKMIRRAQNESRMHCLCPCFSYIYRCRIQLRFQSFLKHEYGLMEACTL